MTARLFKTFIIVSLLVLSIWLPASGDESPTQHPAILVVVSIADGKVVTLQGDRDLFFTPQPLGSTYKPLLALAALRDGFDPDTKYFCPPRPITAPSTTRCWLAAGHGSIDLKQALAHSCSVYFRELARKTNPKAFHSVLSDFELLPAGRIPQPLTPDDMFGYTDKLRITPAALLSAYISIFTGSDRFRFTADSFDGIASKPVAASPPVKGRSLLIEGLRLAAEEGTVADAQQTVLGFPVFGKTGTAPVPGNDREWNGVFIGFAPPDKPKLAVLTILHNSQGKEAAIAGTQALRDAYKRLFSATPSMLD